MKVGLFENIFDYVKKLSDQNYSLELKCKTIKSNSTRYFYQGNINKSYYKEEIPII